MKKYLFSVLILVLCFSFSYSFDKTSTVTIQEYDDLEIKTASVKLNNFSISEKSAWLAQGMKNIKVSFSAKNKSSKSKHFSVMLVGKDKAGNILWALSIQPMMSTLTEKTTESVEGDSYVFPGTLKKTASIWIRVVGDI